MYDLIYKNSCLYLMEYKQEFQNLIELLDDLWSLNVLEKSAYGEILSHFRRDTRGFFPYIMTRQPRPLGSYTLRHFVWQPLFK